jgi:polysaccharide biosynthesis/export protein
MTAVPILQTRRFESMFTLCVLFALSICVPLSIAQQPSGAGTQDKQALVTKPSTSSKAKENSSKAGSESKKSDGNDPAETAKPDASAEASDVNTFHIGVDDELQISVWREPELSMAVAVRPDGMITLPLLNDVPVLGLTTKELQDLLTVKLKPFVTEPQVTVSVRAIHSRKVFLVGQIPRPGAYQLSGRRTVLEMLAEAGGLNLFAKRSSIYILRKQNGHETRIRFNYKNALKGESDTNIEVLPGDMIVVP